MSGPTTKAREINGLFGKAATAMASDSGEFLARVVKLSGMRSYSLNLSFFPIHLISTKFTAKNKIIGISILRSIPGCSNKDLLSEANMEITARQRKTSCALSPHSRSFAIKFRPMLLPSNYLQTAETRKGTIKTIMMLSITEPPPMLTLPP